jgi:hypothetical protein
MTGQPIETTPARVNQALEKLAQDFERAAKAADRRIPGPALADLLPAWIENLAAQVLAVKGIDPETLEQTEQTEGAGTEGARRPPARPDPARRGRQRTYVETELPDWLEERMPGTRAYTMRPGGCVVLVGQNKAHGWHLHISHPSRLPTWDEIFNAVRTHVPGAVMMGVMIYPGVWDIQEPANRVSLYEIKISPLDLERSVKSE